MTSGFIFGVIYGTSKLEKPLIRKVEGTTGERTLSMIVMIDSILVCVQRSEEEGSVTLQNPIQYVAMCKCMYVSCDYACSINILVFYVITSL